MKEQSKKEITDLAFENSTIQPENEVVSKENVQNKASLSVDQLEQIKIQSQKEIEADVVHLEKSASESEIAWPEEIEAVKREVAQIEDQKKLVVDEAKEKIKETIAQSQEKENLPPGEQAFKEVIGSIDSFSKTYSDKCKDKNYEEIKSILENAPEFEVIDKQIGESGFFEFAKKNPNKAVQYILNIDDSSLDYFLTGEFIDSICMNIRFDERKNCGDMLEIYDDFVKHIGNKDFTDNYTIEKIKAQRQVALLERALDGNDLDFSKLISDYEDALNYPQVQMYLLEAKWKLESKLKQHIGELVGQNNGQEAIKLYSKIQYRSLIRDKELSTFKRDDSLLPEAGRSLISALELREKGDLFDMDKAEKVYYGQSWDELLEIHQQFLKDYPEVYFNATMKSPLDVTKISRKELSAFLENVKDFRYGDKEPLLNQEVIESLCKLDQEKQAKLIQIAKFLVKSPSSEIQRFRSELIAQLANSENPEEDFEKVESIFLKNCLPIVGKINKVFQILYSGEKFAKLVGEKSSPILQKESLRGRQFQIYKDLLNIHLKSNNESLRDYLEVFQEGKGLFEKIDKDGTESLNQEEQKSLGYMLKRLEMLYESSWLKNKEEKNTATSLESRLDNIKKSLMLKNGQKIIQRIEKMYLKPIGLETIDQALDVMNQSGQEAEQRGFSYAREFTENGEAKLDNGDLLKGINFKYLEKILQNGSVAREFLGDSSGSDATPLDTDVAMIKKQNADSSFKKIIGDSAASGYGELLIVLKNKGQFFESSKETISNKKDGLELFFTGVVDEEHYGIRTGFPSTEIDFFVAQNTLKEEELRKIYMDISRKGVYIPVVNNEGRLLFTPEMYKSQRPKDYDFSKLDLKSIKNNLESEKFNPQSILNSFKEVFGEEYSHNSGTWEGYSIEEHTLKVLSQFEKYFAGKDMPEGINNRFFRLLLALHDIGKPQAIDVGNKDFQHYYTMPVLKKVFELEGLTAKEIRLGGTLTGEDPVGTYLQGGKIEDSVQYILQKSAESSMTSEELLDLFLIMFKVDAGSYTKDAGGQESLDNLFEFDKNNRTIDFSKETEKKIEALRNMVKH